jgi:hypothetical protein
MAIKNRKVEKIKHPSILLATYYEHNTKFSEFFFNFLRKLVSLKSNKHFFSFKINKFSTLEKKIVASL